MVKLRHTSKAFIALTLSALLVPVETATSAPTTNRNPVRTEKQSGTGGRAFIQSLLVPGLGQLNQGRKVAGYAFLSGEVLLIGGIIGLRQYASWLEDDYLQFAIQHAGINRERDHQYYVDIGNWMNTRSFNEQRLRDRQFDRLYTNPDDEWQWDSDANRSTFKSTRISADRSRNTALMLIGGVLLNHLFAGIDAARGEGKQLKLSALPTRVNGSPGITINITR